MMVSTRGVKFKFTEGERVLCYEPDPTKAKVLYESKVLQLVVSRDNRGRKIPEYLVHFYGWNSSWDRCVAEDFVLPDNDENRNLQMRLSHDAAIQLKGRKKQKMSSLLKGSFNPNQKPYIDMDRKDAILFHSDTDLQDSNSSNEDGEDDNRDSGDNMEEDEDDGDHDDEDEGRELEGDENKTDIKITIPDVLKDILEDDCFMVTCKNKLVNLPCEPSVISILEGYVKYVAVSCVCGAPLKDTRQQFATNHALPADVETKIMICKEVVDGLRIYFDFCLPALLLYKEEKSQHASISSIAVSSPTLPSPLKKEPVNDSKPVEVAEQHQESQCNSNASTSPRLTRQSRLTVRSSSPVLTLSSKATARHYRKGSQSPNAGSSGEENQPTKRILRSSDKPKLFVELKSEHSPKEQNESELLCPAHTVDSPPVPQKILRHTHKSLSPTPATAEPQKCSSAQSSVRTVTQGVTTPNLLPPAPTNQNSVSSVGSSASSTHSSAPSSGDGASPDARDTSGLLNEVLSWQMLPSHLYEQSPTLPSMVYGAHHLLRLFVKLPAFIRKMNIPMNRRDRLQRELESFLRYLQDKREEFFVDSVYINKEQTNFD